MRRLLRWATGTTTGASRAWRAVLITRVIVGLVFIGFSVGKFFRIDRYLDFYGEIGLPQAVPLILLNGLVELVGGALLLIGAFTRPAALALAVAMLIAFLTAGMTVGGVVHLVLAPLLMVACLLLTISGAGRPAVDRRLRRSVS